MDHGRRISSRKSPTRKNIERGRKSQNPTKTKNTHTGTPRTSSFRSTRKSSKRALLAYVVAIIAICYKWITPNGVSSAIAQIKQILPYEFQSTNQRKINEFLRWLKQNDAVISERLNIAEFREYGGFGLKAVEGKRGGISIKATDELFTIPAHLITSAESVYQQMEKIHPNLPQQFRQKLEKHISSDLVQQDVMIAIHLIAECSMGKNSKFQPYLDIIPQEIVPRLDTFGGDDYMILNDAFLTSVGKESQHTLMRFWNDDDLQKLLVDYVGYRKRQEGARITRQNAACIDFSSFHRFVSIVSSRAMILSDQKFLTPLSGMINYEPRPLEKIVTDTEHPFHLFHQKNLDGSITVRADRNVLGGQQIFEDYGDLDNSLYLEAFGFVPDENPFHCANIIGKHLPQPSELASKGLAKTMIRLGMLPPSRDAWNSYVPDLCARVDGSVDDNNAVRYLTISALSSSPKSLEKCINSLTINSTTLNCLHYPGKDEMNKKTVRKLARRMYCDQKNSLEHDLALLNSLQSGSGTQGKTSIQRVLALKFSIAEKRTLSQLGGIGHSECAVYDEAVASLKSS